MQLVRTTCEDQLLDPLQHMDKVAKSAVLAWSLLALEKQKSSTLEATNKYLQEKAKRTKKQL